MGNTPGVEAGISAVKLGASDVSAAGGLVRVIWDGVVGLIREEGDLAHIEVPRSKTARNILVKD